MPPETILAYLETYRAYVAAERAAAATASAVTAAAQSLQDWKKAALDRYAPASEALPALPDGRAVREVLDALALARSNLLAAWKLVHRSEHDGLMPPPGQE